MATHEDNRHKPLISFIITDYNIPEDLLQECVESVLAVSLADDEREIILVDDGSENPPTATLERYGKCLRYFRQDNRGLSAARNAGIELAQGEYIQFVDGDDCLIPECYNRLVSQLRGDATAVGTATAMDIMMFRFTTAESAANTESNFHHTTGKHFLQHKNLRASACCYIFRRGILGELRFEEGIYHEDELFTPLLLLQAETVCNTSMEAYYYRQRATSITNTKEDKHLKKRIADFLHVITKLNQLSKDKKHRPLTRRVNQLCMDYLFNVATLTGDYGKFCDAGKCLREITLFPLPMHFYTLKYLLVSLLTRTETGCRIIFKCMSR